MAITTRNKSAATKKAPLTKGLVQGKGTPPKTPPPPAKSVLDAANVKRGGNRSQHRGPGAESLRPIRRGSETVERGASKGGRMSKKHWVKVDPATLKVGDEVKLIADGVKITGRLTLENGSQVRLGGFYFNCKGNDTNDREWYVRRPKPKPKPEPQRPDKPPRIAGTFVRVKEWLAGYASAFGGDNRAITVPRQSGKMHAFLGAHDGWKMHDALCAVLELHKPEVWPARKWAPEEVKCEHCRLGDEYEEAPVDYPCPTVQAISHALGLEKQ